ncbi:putative AmmeMemoRadiSam system protein B [Monocercomonoides exilis]|uniref:putative AmmeMemoRadiSam system protein B n=1 Tax=Monocercomonoides exilis TaxID=2049356 RepID=UPI0035595280|nr:putative AmmeMemoRadiSam system protein B [Monocercomonoides exilis]
MSTQIRQAVGAGRWFDSNGASLKREVEGYINSAAVPEISGRIVVGLAPHAGFRYSGPTAGFTFRALRDQPESMKPDVLVIAGFPHHASLRGCAVMDGDAIETPIGRHPIDMESATFLCSFPSIEFAYKYHNGEHSAENEIPFAQCALPGVPIVVVLVGDEGSVPLANALIELNKKKKVCVVCSTDMLHDEDYDKVYKVDANTLELTEKMDIEGLKKKWSYDHQIYCGMKPVMAGMLFAKALGCTKSTILKHACSGDGKEDRSYNVGYGSVVMTI